MNIIATKQTRWTQANRLVFVEANKGQKASAGLDAVAQRGVRIANVFQRILGRSTDVKIGDTTYHLNANSYKKFMQTDSKQSIAEPSSPQAKGQKLTQLATQLITCSQEDRFALTRRKGTITLHLEQLKDVEAKLDQTHPTDPNLRLGSIQQLCSGCVLGDAIYDYNVALENAQEKLKMFTNLKEESPVDTAVKTVKRTVKKVARVAQTATEHAVDNVIEGRKFVKKTTAKAKKEVQKRVLKETAIAAKNNPMLVLEGIQAIGTTPLAIAATAVKKVALASEKAAERALGNLVDSSGEIVDTAFKTNELKNEAVEAAKQGAAKVKAALSSKKSSPSNTEIYMGIFNAKAAIHQAKRDLRDAISCKRKELNQGLEIVSGYVLEKAKRSSMIEPSRDYLKLNLAPANTLVHSGPTLIEQSKAAAKARSSISVSSSDSGTSHGSFIDFVRDRNAATVQGSPDADSASISSFDSSIIEDVFDTFGFTGRSISSQGDLEEGISVASVSDKASIYSGDSGLSGTSFDSQVSVSRSVSESSDNGYTSEEALPADYFTVLNVIPTKETKKIKQTQLFLTQLHAKSPLNQQAITILTNAFDKKTSGLKLDLKAMQKALASMPTDSSEDVELSVCRLLKEGHKKVNDFLAVYAPDQKRALDQEAAIIVAASKPHGLNVLEDEGIKV